MNFLSEIADIVNHPLVQMNKEKLSTMNNIDFSIQSDKLQKTIKEKSENNTDEKTKR